MNSLGIVLKKSDSGYKQEFTLKVHISFFEVILSAAEKVSEYLEPYTREKKSLFEEDTQKALSYQERMITDMFNIALSPAIRNDQRIWSKMREFSKKWGTDSVFILLWQKAVLEAAGNLADKLGGMSEAEYKVIADPNLLPFEGLPMKKEYSLQVLYNAYNSLLSVSPEEAPVHMSYSSYKDVYQTTTYKTFDLWLNLLKLVQLPPGFAKKAILTEYIKSIACQSLSSIAWSHRHCCSRGKIHQTARRERACYGNHLSPSK